MENPLPQLPPDSDNFPVLCGGERDDGDKFEEYNTRQDIDSSALENQSNRLMQFSVPAVLYNFITICRIPTITI